MPISFQSLERVTGAERQDHIALELDAVHLWGIELDGGARCLARCAGWLDEVERHRAARLVREEIRKRYVLAHGGLRAVLSWYLGINPDVVSLDRSATGKPFLTRELRDRSAITFNLSHANNRALIAISKAQEVGADLELVRSDVQAENLSKRFFAHSEHMAIMQSAQDQRASLFFRYWVAKEALLKAQGIGLQGLSDCQVYLETDGVDEEVQTRLGAQFPETLRVCLLPCEKGWEAAVAAQRLDSVKLCGLEPQ